MQTDQKFQIGDKVRVKVSMEDRLWYSSHGKGTEGKIARIKFPDENTEFISYDVMVGTLGQWHPDYELELVDPWLSDFSDEEPILDTKSTKQEVQEALFEVEKFLLVQYVNTQNNEYYSKAVDLLKIREKLLGVL